MEEIVKLICETKEFKEYFKYVTDFRYKGQGINKFYDSLESGEDVIDVVLNNAEFKNNEEELKIEITNSVLKNENGYEVSGKAKYIASILKDNDDLVLNGEKYNIYYGFEDYGNGFGPQGYQKFKEPKVEAYEKFSYSYKDKADLFPSSGSFSM